MNIVRTLSLAASLAVLLAGPGATASRHAASAPMTSPSTGMGARDGATEDAAADARRAKTALDEFSTAYRYLDGVTVTVDATPNGEQAIAYYTEGRIVISRTHTVSVDAILAHEIWHVIDWRDNGRLDWGEDLPPSNSGTYARE